VAEVPVQPDGIQVTVRYFAAARAAVPGTRLATVLSRCSYLCDGIAVRDETKTLRSGDTIDVLPPFAGG